MYAKSTLGRWLGCALLLWGGAAQAQGKLEADVLKLYGGVYATDCAQAQSPRLRVERAALMVEQGNRRLVAQDVQAAFSYFGNSPPPGYLVVLMGQVRGQHSMMFVVYGDAQGQYIQIDADPPVMANLGPVLGKARYNSCDATANQRAADAARQDKQAAVAAKAPAAASQASHPSELVRDKRFKAAWIKALGPLSRERWLAGLEGPAPEIKREQLAGQTWLVAATCKPHDCEDNNAVLVYDDATGRVHGLVYRAGAAGLVGAPPGPLGAELQLIWRQVWRQGR